LTIEFGTEIIVPEFLEGDKAMKPFETYPLGGNSKLGGCKDTNCRHGYGLKLQRLTGQTVCAYCGQNLVDTYEHWLLMSVDHVIPVKEGKNLGITKEWVDDFANWVLCCSACNGFGNRWKLPEGTTRPVDFAAFAKLRDAVFEQRKKVILECHLKEQDYYKSKPWMTK
jgi:5-methylcytosine-specific restriction endonuclease McrA